MAERAGSVHSLAYPWHILLSLGDPLPPQFSCRKDAYIADFYALSRVHGPKIDALKNAAKIKTVFLIT